MTGICDVRLVPSEGVDRPGVAALADRPVDRVCTAARDAIIRMVPHGDPLSEPEAGGGLAGAGGAGPRPEAVVRVERAAADRFVAVPQKANSYFTCRGRTSRGLVTYYIPVKSDDQEEVGKCMSALKSKIPGSQIDLVHGVLKLQDGTVRILKEGDPGFEEMDALRQAFNRSYGGSLAPEYKTGSVIGSPEGRSFLQACSPRIAALSGQSARKSLEQLLARPAIRDRLVRIPDAERQSRVRRILAIDEYLGFKEGVISRKIAEKSRELEEKKDLFSEDKLIDLREEIAELQKQLQMLQNSDRFALAYALLFRDEPADFKSLAAEQEALKELIRGRRWAGLRKGEEISAEEEKYIQSLLLFKAGMQEELRELSYVLGCGLEKNPFERGLLDFLRSDGGEAAQAAFLDADRRAGVSPLELTELKRFMDEFRDGATLRERVVEHILERGAPAHRAPEPMPALVPPDAPPAPALPDPVADGAVPAEAIALPYAPLPPSDRPAGAPAPGLGDFDFPELPPGDDLGD